MKKFDELIKKQNEKDEKTLKVMDEIQDKICKEGVDPEVAKEVLSGVEMFTPEQIAEKNKQETFCDEVECDLDKAKEIIKNSRDLEKDMLTFDDLQTPEDFVLDRFNNTTIICVDKPIALMKSNGKNECVVLKSYKFDSLKKAEKELSGKKIILYKGLIRDDGTVIMRMKEID